MTQEHNSLKDATFKEFWKEPFRLGVIGPTRYGKTTYVDQLIRMLEEPPDPMFQQIYVFSPTAVFDYWFCYKNDNKFLYRITTIDEWSLEKFEEIFNTQKQLTIIEKQNNKVLIVIDDNIRSISLKDQRQIGHYFAVSAHYGVSIIWIGQEIVEGFSTTMRRNSAYVLLGPLSKRDEHIAKETIVLPTYDFGYEDINEVMSIIRSKPFHFVLLRFAGQPDLDGIYDTCAVINQKVIIERQVARVRTALEVEKKQKKKGYIKPRGTKGLTQKIDYHRQEEAKQLAHQWSLL